MFGKHQQIQCIVFLNENWISYKMDLRSKNKCTSTNNINSSKNQKNKEIKTDKFDLSRFKIQNKLKLGDQRKFNLPQILENNCATGLGNAKQTDKKIKIENPDESEEQQSIFEETNTTPESEEIGQNILANIQDNSKTTNNECNSKSPKKRKLYKKHLPNTEDDNQMVKREHIKVEYDPMIKNKICTTAIKLESKIPLHWNVVLDNLREMRKTFDAPVDSMGCHKCCDESAPPKVRF